MTWNWVNVKAGEDLGGVEEGETVNKIYCMKKIFSIKKIMVLKLTHTKNSLKELSKC